MPKTSQAKREGTTYFFSKCFVGFLNPHNFPADCVPDVVLVVGLVNADDLWGYAVEPLMPDRPKVTFQTKRDTGVYAVHGWSRFASRTRLLISRACASEPETVRDGVSPEEDPTSLKMAKLESVTW